MPTTERELLDKYQAAKRLGLHWRSILLFAKNGTLKATRIRDPKTNHLTTKFAVEDVERLRKERAAPAPIDVGEKPVKTETQALQRLQPQALFNGLLEELARNTAKPPRPWLTLKEAAEYTGWPLRGVIELIDSGQLPRLDFGKGTRGGQYRIKRADLDALQGVVVSRNRSAAVVACTSVR